MTVSYCILYISIISYYVSETIVPYWITVIEINTYDILEANLFNLSKKVLQGLSALGLVCKYKLYACIGALFYYCMGVYLLDFI